MIDVASGEITDLTALRQQSGFNAIVLNESDPKFLGTGGNVVTLGNNLILITTGAAGEGGEIDLNNPSTLTAVPLRLVPDGGVSIYIPGNHYELILGSAFDENILNNNPVASPDGHFFAEGGSIWTPEHIDAATHVDCPVGQRNLALLGWVDSRHIALQADDIGGNTLGVAEATLDMSGHSIGCNRLLPDTTQTISNPLLSIDGQTLYVTAESASGPIMYSVPTTGSLPRTPVQAVYPTVPGRIFFPFG